MIVATSSGRTRARELGEGRARRAPSRDEAVEREPRHARRGRGTTTSRRRREAPGGSARGAPRVRASCDEHERDLGVAEDLADLVLGRVGAARDVDAAGELDREVGGDPAARVVGPEPDAVAAPEPALAQRRARRPPRTSGASARATVPSRSSRRGRSPSRSRAAWKAAGTLEVGHGPALYERGPDAGRGPGPRRPGRPSARRHRSALSGTRNVCEIASSGPDVLAHHRPEHGRVRRHVDHATGPRPGVVAVEPTA